MTSYRPSSKKGHETEMRTRQRHRHRQTERGETDKGDRESKGGVDRDRGGGSREKGQIKH